jgi:DNA-binding NarL/FixJ family response regulator
LGATSIRVLVVDDYEPWRRFIRLTLLAQERLQIVGEAIDGPEAIQQAQELQPDLILLDIGLPTSNGIEVARRIRDVSPKSRILFVSENRSPDIVEEALGTGAGGYVVKSVAASELLQAVNTVLKGERFVSSSVAGYNPAGSQNKQAHNQPHAQMLVEVGREVTHRHEVKFYPDDSALVDGLAGFIGATLKSGNPVVVLATPSHRTSIVKRLKEEGVDVGAAVEQKRYIPLDAADSFPAFRLAEHLTGEAVTAAKERNLRVGVG